MEVNFGLPSNMKDLQTSARVVVLLIIQSSCSEEMKSYLSPEIEQQNFDPWMRATSQRFQPTRKEEQAKTTYSTPPRENQMVSTPDPVSPNNMKTTLTHSSRYVPSVKASNTGHHRTPLQNISNLHHSRQTYPKSLEPFHLSKAEHPFRPTRIPILLRPNKFTATTLPTHDNLNTSSPYNQLALQPECTLVKDNILTIQTLTVS